MTNNTRKIQMMTIGAITPYFRNPRSSGKTITAVARSITRYGFNVPICIDAEGVIVTGHSRYFALLRLDWNKEVPCIVLADLSSHDLTMYRIDDNLSQNETKWDKKGLSKELTKFKDDFGDVFKDSAVDMFTIPQLQDLNINIIPTVEGGDYSDMELEELEEEGGGTTGGIDTGTTTSTPQGQEDSEEATEMPEEGAKFVYDKHNKYKDDVVVCPYCNTVNHRRK